LTRCEVRTCEVRGAVIAIVLGGEVDESEAAVVLNA
jgi:hypothetical protein